MELAEQALFLSNGCFFMPFGCVVAETFTVRTPINAAAYTISVPEYQQQQGRSVRLEQAYRWVI